MYNRLLSSGLINTASFSSEHLEGPGYGTVMFLGESNDPEQTAEIIREYVKKARKEGLEKDAFERAKKAVYGQSLSAFNNVPAIANLTLEFDFSGKEIFEYMNVLQEVTLEKVNKCLGDKLDPAYSALSVVKPL